MSSSGSSHEGGTRDATRRASEAGAPASFTVGLAVEQEIHTTLGRLLGMLEVMANDGREPLQQRQRAWLDDALQHGHALKAQIEALVVLCADYSGRIERRACSLRRMVEHAMRGAAWGGLAGGVHLMLPRDEAFDELEIHADAQLLERMLRGIADCLLGVVGQDGVLEVGFVHRGDSVELSVCGRSGSVSASALSGVHGPSELLCAAWVKIAHLHGGSLALDPKALRAVLSLPL